MMIGINITHVVISCFYVFQGLLCIAWAHSTSRQSCVNYSLNSPSLIRGLAKRLLFAVGETPPDIVNDLFHLCSGAVMWRLAPL